MKKQLRIFLSLSFTFLVLSIGAQLKKSPYAFTENKGQVSDQNGQFRPDVLFSCNAGVLTYHLRNNGISYQLSKVDRWKSEEPEAGKAPEFMRQKHLVPEQTSIYRIDLEWLNINPQANVQTDDAFPGFSNYYSAVCPQGVHQVKSYSGLSYKNIYKDIDLHYYLKGSDLKYDYLVAAYADYRQIKIKIKGASKITLQNDGSVILQTPLGEIKEAAPLVYQGKKQLAAKWILNKDELSFSIRNYEPSLPLLIDPLVRTWGTYYGGSGIEEGKGCTTDPSGNAYMTGRTNSSAAIATSGSHMSTLSGIKYDAFLVKFNNAGVRQWCTYYGGSDDDYGNACIADASGNVYMAGQAGNTSSSGIASPGTAHQGFQGGGGWDAFLVKFNSAGARLWGTYYGGSGYDIAEALALDPSSNVYMSGYATSFPGTSIATSGAHQTATLGSAFLVKLTPGGTRLWGTYYGDSQYSHGSACATDASGNVYLAGTTDAVNMIATPGAHQLAWIGMMDGFLAKFNSAGVRQWGTYYGEISYETVSSCAVDASGNVYIAGSSGSPTGIATPGSHQTVIGTVYNPDAMLVKFNSAGVRQWGTYYGGTTEDYASSCIIAPNGDIYMAGMSNSSLGIATSNGLQTSFAGGATDGFLVRFDAAGVRLWATYYGGAGDDVANSCASDANGTIYLAGKSGTASVNGIATNGSYQQNGGATIDAMLAQFFECTAPANPVNSTAAGNMTVCSGSSATLSATGSGTVNWYASATAPTSLGTGSVFTSPPLSAGTATYFAETTNSCSLASGRTPVILTVIAGPPTTVSSSNAGLCPGGTATLTVTGAGQYSWNTGANTSVITITPSATTAYTVTGFAANGCSAQASIAVVVHPLPAITINGGSTPVCTGATATLTASGASQYSWNTSASGSLIVISPQGPTSYIVTGTSAEGCTGVASIAVQVSNCTGLKETERGSLHVFPNPSKGMINVQTAYPVDIKVINVIGQILLQQKADTGINSIDLSNYVNGIYFIEIKYAEETKFIKLAKE